MLDTRGLSCPTPVVMTQKALKDGPETLEVLCDSRVAVENVSRFARSRGYQVAETPEGPDFRLTLRK
jgi:tRNA 2-thiouridine synthesizing protein A